MDQKRIYDYVKMIENLGALGMVLYTYVKLVDFLIFLSSKVLDNVCK